MRRLLLAGVAVALLASTAAIYAYSRFTAIRGAYIVIHGLPRGYAALYIEAVEPRGPVPFLAAAYRVPGGGTLVVKLPGDKLQALAEKWHERRPGLAEFGAIIHLIVVDSKTERIRLHLLDSISMPVDRVLAGKPLVIEATVKKLSNTTARLTGLRIRQPSLWELLTLKPAKNVEKKTEMEAVETPQPLGAAPEPPGDGAPPNHRVCIYIPELTPSGLALIVVCWDPLLYITPGNLAYLYGNKPDAVKYQDGLLYVQTPIAVVYNKYYLSGVLGFSVGLEAQTQTYKIYPSFGVDLTSLVKAVKKHVPIPLPSLQLWRGSGATWGGDKYHFYDLALVFPEKHVTFYIYARPFHAMYNVTVGVISSSPLMMLKKSEVEAEAVISDVMIENKLIYGRPVKYLVAGDYEGTPPDEVMEVLLRGGSLVYATTLAPQEGVMLQDLLESTTGSCGASFGISIPVGAIAATIACSALASVPIADVLTVPECAPLIAAASNFQVSFVAEPGQLKVYGGVKNMGRVQSVGYDLNEPLYVEISSYSYDLGSCSARVPLGFYIESR